MSRKDIKAWLTGIGTIALIVGMARLVLPYDGPKGVAKELPKPSEARAESVIERPSISEAEQEETTEQEEATGQEEPIQETYIAVTPQGVQVAEEAHEEPPAEEEEIPEIIEEVPEETEVIVEEVSEEPEEQAEEVEEEPEVFWNDVPSGPHLTRSGGVYYYGSQKETWYNLPMGGVIRIMGSYGYSEADYWVREDGCKMLGDYIMVAANLSVHPRGTTVQTSLGVGLVCDTGGFAYSDPYAIDIAVNW